MLSHFFLCDVIFSFCWWLESGLLSLVLECFGRKFCKNALLADCVRFERRKLALSKMEKKSSFYQNKCRLHRSAAPKLTKEGRDWRNRKRRCSTLQFYCSRLFVIVGRRKSEAAAIRVTFASVWAYDILTDDMGGAFTLCQIGWNHLKGNDPDLSCIDFFCFFFIEMLFWFKASHIMLSNILT